MKSPLPTPDTPRSFAKQRLLFAGIVLMLGAVLTGLFLATPSPPAQSLSQTPGTAGVSAAPAPVATPPFWESAAVAEPLRVRLPTAAIVPPLPAPGPVRDYATEIRALEPQGPAQPLIDLFTLWFASDPAAATDWLNATPRFDDIAQAVSSAAQSLNAAGHTDTALAWADAITEPALRQETRMQIYAQAIRTGALNRMSLSQAGFDEAEIETIISGSLTD